MTDTAPLPSRTLTRAHGAMSVLEVFKHDAYQLHAHLLARGFPGPECPPPAPTDTFAAGLQVLRAWLWSRLGAVAEARQPDLVLVSDIIGRPQAIADRIDAWLTS